MTKAQPTFIYNAPNLRFYGKLAELTAGGSGLVTEAAAGNMSVNNSRS